MSELEGRYPSTLELKGKTVELALMTGETEERDVRDFAESLPANDLLFLSRDIREPKVVEAWLRQIREGEIISVAARLDGKVVGTTAVVTDKLSFSSHVGELRVLVGPEAREIGLGRKLIQEAFLVGMDLGLDKLTARMTLDQDAAITVFEEMGFRKEAMFLDHVKDADGKKHDLLIMAHDVDVGLGAERAQPVGHAA